MVYGGRKKFSRTIHMPEETGKKEMTAGNQSERTSDDFREEEEMDSFV